MMTVGIVAVLGAISAESPAGPVTYDADVRPIFRKHCLACHNPERPRGDLDLSTYAAALAGSASGQTIVAGKPDESLVYTLTAHLEDPKMPPNKPKIPQREIDTIRAWIETGLIEKPKDTASVTRPQTETGLVAAVPLRRLTPITALAVSPKLPVVAVSGRHQVLLFDTTTGTLSGGLPFPMGDVQTLAFSRDGTVLLAGGGVGGASGVVVGYEMPSGRKLFAAGEELDTVLAADLAPDRSQVVLGGPGRVVKVLSTTDGKPRHTLRKPTDWVTAVGFSPEGLLVAAGDRFGGVFLWEAESGQEFWTLRGHTKAIRGLAWRQDADVLATASEDSTVRTWDLHTGQQQAMWDAHPGGVTAMTWHPSGRIVTGGRDGRIKVWDETGQLLADLGPTAEGVTRVGMTADGSAVVSGDWSGMVHLWPLTGGKPAPLPLPVLPAATVAMPVPQLRALPVRSVTQPALSKLDIATRELAAAKEALAAATRAVAEAERVLQELSAEQNRPRESVPGPSRSEP